MRMLFLAASFASARLDRPSASLLIASDRTGQEPNPFVASLRVQVHSAGQRLEDFHSELRSTFPPQDSPGGFYRGSPSFQRATSVRQLRAAITEVEVLEPATFSAGCAKLPLFQRGVGKGRLLPLCAKNLPSLRALVGAAARPQSTNRVSTKFMSLEPVFDVQLSVGRLASRDLDHFPSAI